MPRLVTTNLRFEAALWDDLGYRARQRGTTIALIVREAVAQYLLRSSASTPTRGSASPTA
jgi:hypothetical protein